MKDQTIINKLNKLEDKITNETVKPDFRDCLIASLCVKNFTIETAAEIEHKNMLLCTVYDMNLAVCLKNEIRIQELEVFNDEDNMIYIINCMKTHEPLTIINNEISCFLKASKKLVVEIREIMNTRTFSDKSESILRLFDEDTQERVKKILKKTFDCYKFEFSVELVFKNKDGKEIIHEVEYAFREFERNKGLSERPQIPNGAGMFYEFPDEKIFGFITKNVVRELSVAYIKDDGTITEIIDRKANDNDVYHNKVPCKYVLEMTKGWFAEHDIHEGDNVKMKSIICNEL